ncbi:hypothetical protein AB0E10_40535 [Streptomyces sp. NPDC048045]
MSSTTSRGTTSASSTPTWKPESSGCRSSPLVTDELPESRVLAGLNPWHG